MAASRAAMQKAVAKHSVRTWSADDRVQLGMCVTRGTGQWGGSGIVATERSRDEQETVGSGPVHR